MSQPTKKPNFQNVILSELKSKKTEVTVFLVNGFQLKGVIRAFDNFVVILNNQMIYKHAISTIQPPQGVSLPLKED